MPRPSQMMRRSTYSGGFSRISADSQSCPVPGVSVVMSYAVVFDPSDANAITRGLLSPTLGYSGAAIPIRSFSPDSAMLWYFAPPRL